LGLFFKIRSHLARQRHVCHCTKRIRRRSTVTAWMNDELSTIGAAEELEIASLRSDGTLRKPVTIWVVRVGDDLYVRSVNGRSGSWFCGAQDRHVGRIETGGIQKDATFVD